MIPRLSYPIASTSKLPCSLLLLHPQRSFHLSSPTSSSSSSSPPPPPPHPHPQPSPSSSPRPPPNTSTPTKPRKVDSQRKSTQYKPTILGGEQQKDVIDKRKLLMDEWTRFFPSQKGEIERPEDFDNEPLHAYNAKENGFSELIQPSDDAELSFRRVTAKDVANRIIPPTSVTMLTRDFVDDHLYNPNYGYFSSPSLEIFTSPPIDIPTLKNGAAFTQTVAARYEEYHTQEKDFSQRKNREFADTKERRRNLGITKSGAQGELFPEISRREQDGKQIWHTPTEIFKPWYGRAVARAIVSDYKLKHFPYDDLIIFEMGAGNGTLMTNILDYIQEQEPEVYEHTSYRIIEITTQLALKQLESAKEHGHQACVEIINKSIFDWDEVINEPCYFMGMEVLDNFTHDMIRYDLLTGLPLQAVIVTDPIGDFTTVYEPVSDPLVAQYLALRALLPPPHNASPAMPKWFANSPFLRWLKFNLMPFAANLTKPEWIPTKAMVFMEVLRDKFPKHRLLLADFTSLEESLEGWNAPVVQTRQLGEMIPVTTVMVKHGFFDIFFPTNFPLFLSLYTLIQTLPPNLPPPPPHLLRSPLSVPHLVNPAIPTPLPPTFFNSHPPLWPPKTDQWFAPRAVELEKTIKSRPVRVWTHAEFLSHFGEDGGMTRTRDGEDVMLRWYRNAGFLF
ncbi:S-adenosyl-L-methionine-dependent methyltransferase [Mrakia frigida]|uniref:S-adenosyl-L-methionine-dependent methyltransferase n=1 Tax=Mrakia frigida TaxID=29902 RepID=UPI003FCBFFC3